jgi:hypothetical protein
MAKSERVVQSRHKPVSLKLSARTSSTGDFSAEISEAAINGFLAAHYKKHPEFYDRSRSAQPNSPLYEQIFNDHNSPRRVRIWAKVEQVSGSAAVELSLAQDAALDRRFAAWWQAVHGGTAASRVQPLPPRVSLVVRRVLLQVNIPRLDGAGGEHQIDLPFKISVQTYAHLEKAIGGTAIKFFDWDIGVTAIADPLDPADPIWGGTNLPAPCVNEINRLRLIIRDIFTLGANIALTQLAKTLTTSLPLPPIDIVQGLKLAPSGFYVNNRRFVLETVVDQSQILARISALYAAEMARFEQDMQGTSLEKILSGAPTKSQSQLEQYMLKNVPAYANLDKRNKHLKAQYSTKLKKTRAADPNADLVLSISPNLVDVLAKQFLKADMRDCSPWLSVDVAIGYARGRGCVWFYLKDAKGGISNTTVSMSCQAGAGGQLELQACIRNPCGSDQCTSWNPGIGLRGPLGLDVTASGGWNTNNNANTTLRLSAQFSAFPGLEVYGLPPGIDDIVNAVLNYLSSAILKMFFNAILQALNFDLVSIPLKVPETKVDLTIDRFGASNEAGYLVITGRTQFS